MYPSLTTRRVTFLVLASVALGPVSAMARERLLAVSGDLGFGGFGDQAIATFQSALDIREGDLALGLFGRVRLGLAGEEAGSVRKRDFDEVSDYVHIVRYLHYRRHFGAVELQARGGEILGFTLGQGTLVADYSNIADPDHPHAGLRLSVEAERLGFEALVDNVVRPAVLAGRAVWHPAALEGFDVAASVAVDPRAPRRVSLDVAGQRRMDRAFNLESEDEVLVLTGLEAAYRVGSITGARLTPYTAGNTSWHGLGWHLGANAHLPLAQSGIELAGQLEYRLTSGGYAPGYVGTFYDLRRFQAALNFSDPERAAADQRATPLDNLKAGRYGGHGSLAQIGLDAGRLARVRLGHAYHPGPLQHRVWFRGATEPLRALSLGLMVLFCGIGRDLQGADGLAILAEGRYRLSDNLYALAQFARTWALDAQTRYFAPLQSFNIAIGGNWSD